MQNYQTAFNKLSRGVTKRTV